MVSGYLITDLLVLEVERTGRIDFRRFYARRIRRLLPAALLMLVCTLLVGFAVLSPMEIVRLSKSAIAAAAYSSNVWFLSRSTDYFSPSVEANPLLHTWSLAVEEQFYLVWPLLVLFCMKWNRPRKMIVGVFAGITVLFWRRAYGSLATALAFFGTPARAWEFSAGGLATLLQNKHSLRALRSASSAWLGAALILIGAISITPTHGFPGAIALIPVIGTILILVAGKFSTSQTGLFSILGSRGLQRLGGLSYSWYLWHWPVLIFGRILLPGKPGPLTAVPLLLASLAVAFVTHSLIENPLRFNRGLIAKPRYSLALGAALTISGLLAGTLSMALGKRSSTSPREVEFLNAAANSDSNEHDCLTGFRRDQLKVCSFGPSDATTLVLFGDSHAEQWLPALTQVAIPPRWHVITLLKAACPSATVPVYNPRLEREEYECSAWRTKALSYIYSIKPSIVLVSDS